MTTRGSIWRSQLGQPPPLTSLTVMVHAFVAHALVHVGIIGRHGGVEARLLIAVVAADLGTLDCYVLDLALIHFRKNCEKLISRSLTPVLLFLTTDQSNTPESRITSQNTTCLTVEFT